jgi:hypothetical protein
MSIALFQKIRTLHVHDFRFLREEYRVCPNPAFEQKVVIRQCTNCLKISELHMDTFRLTQPTE